MGEARGFFGVSFWEVFLGSGRGGVEIRGCRNARMGNAPTPSLGEKRAEGV